MLHQDDRLPKARLRCSVLPSSSNLPRRHTLPNSMRFQNLNAENGALMPLKTDEERERLKAEIRAEIESEINADGQVLRDLDNRVMGIAKIRGGETRENWVEAGKRLWVGKH